MTLLDQISDIADELTEARQHREPYTVWDHNRHRKTRHHITIQPGLLAQLYQSVIPAWSTGEEPAGGVPGSRPPLAVEALSRHDEIAMAALGWCDRLGITGRVSVESNVRALVGGAGNLDRGQLAALHADMRRWRGWCNVYLGWEHVVRIAGVRCPLPDCSTLSSLRINLTNATAVCHHCGADWSAADGSITVLAAHIKASSRARTKARL